MRERERDRERDRERKGGEGGNFNNHRRYVRLAGGYSLLPCASHIFCSCEAV